MSPSTSGKIAACEQIDIVAPAVVVIAGDVARIAVLHAPGRMREDIPDAFAASVFVDRAFDLIARSRRAPHEVGGKRSVVGGSSIGARSSTRGEQADGRGQQPSARQDQHRGRAAPAGAHGREGGGIGMKSASGRAIDRSGDDWAARGVRLMIARRRHASSKPARAQTSKPRRGRYSRSLKFGALGEIRTHDLCLRRIVVCVSRPLFMRSFEARRPGTQRQHDAITRTFCGRFPMLYLSGFEAKRTCSAV
jgi:hypothetical protein